MASGRFGQCIIVGVMGAVMAGAVFAAGMGLAEVPPERSAGAGGVSSAARAWLETPGEAPPTGPAVSTVRHAPAAGDGCRRSSVVGLTDPGLRGRASLCVTRGGTHSTLEAEGLTAGDTYIVQFGYFEWAAACSTPICRVEDALAQDPAGVVARLDGGVARGGTTVFWGEFRDLRPSLGAQIVLLLFGNGAAIEGDTRARADQLLRLLPSGPGAPQQGEAGALVGYAAFDFPFDP